MDQPQQVQETHSHHVLIKIVVNGRERQVDHEVLSYEEVVALAFPGSPQDPNLIFNVTYEHAAGHPSAGILDEGQTIKIKQGTRFNVRKTGKS